VTRGTAAAAALVVAAFLLAYAPDAGHGFISDDFRWLRSAKQFVDAPSPGALLDTTGFFRPLITLSFAVQWPLFGLNAAGYGLTNLLLVFLCAMLIDRICRAQQLPAPAALVAAFAWMFNFHGINIAVLWISGRTSLLLTCFALLAAWNTLNRRRWRAAVWCGAALFCKEEALALPFILIAWVGIRAAWPSLLGLPPYVVLRAGSDAFWPQNAPDYYRFVTDAGLIATNAAHYVDRACTVFVVVGFVVMIVARTPLRFDAGRRAQIMRGLIWLAGGYALTLWIPVRSSLYAVFPSAGAAIMLAALLDGSFSRMEARLVRRVGIALVLLSFLAIPILRARNVRWVELADLSRQVMHDLAPHASALQTGVPLWIVDDTSTRANVGNAFAAHLSDAVQLFFASRTEIHVTSDPAEPPTGGAIVLRLQSGRLRLAFGR